MLCTYHNANRKYLYPYCVGGKTGYTATANSTLVTYAGKRWYDTDLCGNEHAVAESVY